MFPTFEWLILRFINPNSEGFPSLERFPVHICIALVRNRASLTRGFACSNSSTFHRVLSSFLFVDRRVFSEASNPEELLLRLRDLEATMGNKRQRLAKKRLVADGTITVKPTDGGGEKESRESTSNRGDKKAGAKKRANESGDGDGAAKKNKVASGSKHPLRQAGMKPGEGCFLCKSKDHIAKHCPTKSEKDRHKMCLGCRMWGHTLKNCPSEFKSTDSKLCYNCGEAGHSLDKCPKPLKDGGSTFAECFLCKERGHLSRNCPENKHGIYPKGGCCKICEAVTHLAKDCPQKNSGKFAGNARVKLKISADSTQVSSGVGGKRTVFKSGDDLEDDFQEDKKADNSDGSDGEVDDDEPGSTSGAALTQETNTKDTPRTLLSGKSNGVKYNPKVVKF